MNKQIKTIPKGWQVYNLKNDVQFLKGFGLSKSKIVGNGQNKCVLYGELYTKYKETIRNVVSSTNSSEGAKSKAGDVLMPGSTTTKGIDLANAVAINEDNVLLGGDIIIIRDKNKIFNNYYFAHYLTHIRKKDIEKLTQGTTIIHLYPRSLENLEIMLPPINEQNKISEILSKVDEDIEKTEKIIKETEKLKNGLMQNVLSFNKKETIKYMALGNIGKVSMCKRVFKNETSNIGDIPFYKIGTFGKKPDSFIPQELFDKYRKKFSFPKVGDVLLSASGTIGRKVKYDGKPAYFQDSNIIWLEHDESKVLNNFLFYLYDTIKWQTEGSTIKRLYNSIFLKKIIPVPSIDKQIQIVGVLSRVDNKIEINKQIKNKLIQLKKGLMNDLLNGRVRVN